MNALQIKADFLIVTPMFLGEADQAAKSIRPQSIKGELAFWWRALHYAGYVANVTEEKPDPLETMHNDETLLFGGAKRQAAFLLSVQHGFLPTLEKGRTLTGAGVGCGYLGYGVMDPQRELTRNCFDQGGEFSLKILFRPQFFKDRDGNLIDRSALVTGLINALKIMGLLGGLGSRKRRGFGSLSMTALDVFGEPYLPQVQTVGQYQDCIRAIIGECVPSGVEDGENFPLSAFSKVSHLRVTKKGFARPLECQNDAGEAFRLYRAWGKGGFLDQHRTIDSLKNFEPDHHWFKHEGKLDDHAEWADRSGFVLDEAHLPERANFGLPHNYFKKDWGKLSVELKGDQTGRRASPLLFHIVRIGGVYHCVLTFFNTMFMPEPRLRLTNTTHGKVVLENGGEGFSDAFEYDATVILDFMQGKMRSASSKGTLKTYLQTIEVLP
jgi:CRISPR-associated protein Cmr1